MSTIDPFAAQLVSMVRQMPDETLLELIRNQLGATDVAAAPEPAVTPTAKPKAKPRATAKPKQKSKPAAKKKQAPKQEPQAKPAAQEKPAAQAKPAAKAKPAPKKKTAPKQKADVARDEVLASVEKLVNSSNGVAVADIAKGLSLAKSRVASAVRQLKQAKRIFQGGDRRFARYASSLEKAKAASDRARGKA